VTVGGALGVGKVRRSHTLANPTHSLGGRWWAARTVSTSPQKPRRSPPRPLGHRSSQPLSGLFTYATRQAQSQVQQRGCSLF
jgi:hypothetical protein